MTIKAMGKALVGTSEIARSAPSGPENIASEPEERMRERVLSSGGFGGSHSGLMPSRQQSKVVICRE